MTPEEQHEDAVEAVREWRDELRRRYYLPPVDRAQARLDAMTAPDLPTEGDRIVIRWPGGPYDFVMDFLCERTPRPPTPGWHFLHGVIVEPARWYPNPWSPMAHLVDGEWTMKPAGEPIGDA